jgi:hypothetical protein
MLVRTHPEDEQVREASHEATGLEGHDVTLLSFVAMGGFG